MGDYFAHWLSMPERTDESKLPRIYGVNWFRKDDDGAFLWPGYGENSRVLEWICRRLEGDADGAETPDRRGAPARGPRRSTGLDAPTASTSAPRSRVDPEEWRRELPTIREHFDDLRRPAARRRCATSSPPSSTPRSLRRDASLGS